MKKLFMIAATAALFFATGCERTNSIPAGQSKIVVKLNGVSAATATRSVEAPATLTGTGEEGDESTAELETAWVFVISEAEGVFIEEMDVEEAMDAGFTIGKDEGTSTEFPDKLFPSDSEVYVLGNVPDDVDPTTLTSWEAIQEAVSVISYTLDEESNTDFSKPAMANADGEPAALENVSVENHTATVSIDLSPLYSRVELHRLTGGEHILNFTVAGVYINNYYRAFNMTGAGVATEDYPQYVHAAGSEDFTGAWGDENGETGWEASPGDLGDNEMNTNAFATAGGTNVWAHNVGSGSVVTFIIKITDVEYYKEDEETGVFENEPSQFDGDMYLNVTGYNGFSGNFQRGYIYTIDDLEFDHTDLTEDPVTGVSILANVNVNNWKVKKLEPILGE